MGLGHVHKTTNPKLGAREDREDGRTILPTSTRVLGSTFHFPSIIEVGGTVAQKNKMMHILQKLILEVGRIVLPSSLSSRAPNFRVVH